MATVTGNPLDAALVKALGDTLTVWLGPVTIVRGWTNRVSTPSTRYFVQITPSGGTPHGTTGHVYTGPDGSGQGQAQVVRPQSRRVQLDFVGPNAEEQSRTASTLLQDIVGCDALAPYGFAPLSVSEPQDLTAADDSEQAESRWMIALEVQANSNVTVPLDYFDNVNLHLHPQA